MPKRSKIHRPMNRSREAKREQQQYDSTRGSSSSRGYGYAWQKLRLSHLNEHPLCVDCQSQGLIVPANEVDHIDGNSLNNESTNLQSLCKSCHSKKTVQCQGGLGR